MLKIVVIACALLGILTAVSIESWLRTHVGNRALASDVYNATLEKYSEFWFALLIPLLVMHGLIGALIGFGIGLIPVVAYVSGAITCFIAVFIGSRSYTSGTVAGSSLAADGDIKSAMKASYRSGAVMGLATTIISIAALSALTLLINTDQIPEAASGFALGATLSALGIRFTGTILTSAHKLSAADEHNVDYVGIFAAIGSDFTESLILSACSAALLAEVGVATAGVLATFSVSSLTRYPIVILSSGLAASVIGILVFRAFTGKYSHYGFTAGSLVAGIIVFAAALYFSEYSLDDRAYSYCIGFGILAQLLSGEFSKSFTMESPVFSRDLPKSKDETVDVPMLHGLSIGLTTVFVPGILTAVALLLSFNIARYYGVALAAVGASSITAVNLAVRTYAASLASSASYSEKADEKSEENSGYYHILRRNSAVAKSCGRSYSCISSALTLTSLLMAFTVKADKEIVDLTHPIVFGGMIIGTIIIIVFLGFWIRAILSSTNAMLDTASGDTEEYRTVASVHGVAMLIILTIASPALVGTILGVECTIGFIAAAIVTGMTLVFAFNNTGRYYDRIASDVLATVIKTMTVVAIICIPVFTAFGGFNL